MESEAQITSPVPIHATSGSTLSASIPLLDEQAQQTATLDQPDAEAKTAAAAATDENEDASLMSPAVDHKANPDSDSSDGEVDETEAPTKQEPAAAVEGSASPAEEGEYDPDDHAYAAAAPPASVDLQALLRSFNAQSAPAAPPAMPAAPSATVATSVEPPWHQVPASAAPVATIHDSPQDDAIYEHFLVDERAILATTAPHEFEPGARMFLGNLSSESTTKREVFFLFSKYGRLGQIALKPNFGFVQFMQAADCRAAITAEQGRPFKDRKLQLEISNPPRTKGARAAAAAAAVASGVIHSTQALYPHNRRDSRSRSPITRRHASPPHHHRDRDSGGGGGSRRSRRRSRSRTRSPPRRSRDYERSSYRRTPTPPPAPPPPPPQAFLRPPVAPAANGLPTRFGNDIPEVQLIVTDRADTNYTYWVETTIRAAGLRTDIFFMSPKYVLGEVVRQQIIEGVLAVVFLNTSLQTSSHVQVQVFDRSMGAGNVRFEEYASLEVPVAVQLLLRERTKAASYAPPPPAMPAYPSVGQPGRLTTPAAPFMPPPMPTFPGQPPAGADLAAVISQMDPAALQQVIGALTAQQNQQHQQQQQPPPSSAYPNHAQLEEIMRNLRR